MERHSFRIVLGEKLCFSIKFPHQKIRWNYGILCSVRFIWCEKFPYGFVNLIWWEDVTYCLSFVLFGHENGSFEFLQKTISNMADSSKKNFKKSRCSNNNTQKKSNIIIFNYIIVNYFYIFWWIHIALYPLPVPPPFLKEGNEISKKLGRGSNFQKKSVWETNRRKVEEMGCIPEKNRGV